LLPSGGGIKLRLTDSEMMEKIKPCGGRTCQIKTADQTARLAPLTTQHLPAAMNRRQVLMQAFTHNARAANPVKSLLTPGSGLTGTAIGSDNFVAAVLKCRNRAQDKRTNDLAV
jgi:hypothetical protein